MQLRNKIIQIYNAVVKEKRGDKKCCRDSAHSGTKRQMAIIIIIIVLLHSP